MGAASPFRTERPKPRHQGARLRHKPGARAAPRARGWPPTARQHTRREKLAKSCRRSQELDVLRERFPRQSAAAIFSLVASWRLHGIDPQQYLDEVMRVLPYWPKHRYLELAPR